MEWLCILGFLVVFAGVAFFIFWSNRRSRQRKLEISRALGFTPVEPEPALIVQLAELYQSAWMGRMVQDGEQYRLENLSRKRLPDADLYLFDLVSTSGGNDSLTENGAVAVVSDALDLPSFQLVPKVEMPGPLAQMGNRLMAWLVERFGEPLAFPEAPDFEQRYLVSSRDPERTRQFLDAYRLHRLVKTRQLGVVANEGIFIVSRLQQTASGITQESMSELVDEAQELFLIFS